MSKPAKSPKSATAKALKPLTPKAGQVKGGRNKWGWVELKRG